MSLQANNLLVDIGNTRLKWAVGNHLDIIPGDAILNVNVSHVYLSQLWENIAPPRQLAVACVGNRQLMDTVTSVATLLWPGIKLTQAKSQAESFGVKNAYMKPEALGVDRWLGMVAAYNRYQTDLCVVGCGTAVTVDIIDATGQHLGGLICPGLRLMKESLANNTENLSLAEVAYTTAFANNTDAAIHNGAMLAVCGLITQAIKNHGNDLQLILTGGDADLIATHLAKQAIVDQNLVLSGLALTLTKA